MCQTRTALVTRLRVLVRVPEAFPGRGLGRRRLQLLRRRARRRAGGPGAAHWHPNRGATQAASLSAAAASVAGGPWLDSESGSVARTMGASATVGRPGHAESARARGPRRWATSANREVEGSAGGEPRAGADGRGPGLWQPEVRGSLTRPGPDSEVAAY